MIHESYADTPRLEHRQPLPETRVVYRHVLSAMAVSNGRNHSSMGHRHMKFEKHFMRQIRLVYALKSKRLVDYDSLDTPFPIDLVFI